MKTTAFAMTLVTMLCVNATAQVRDQQDRRTAEQSRSVAKQASQFQSEIPAFDVVAYSKDGRAGPGKYGLDRKVQQTVILAKDGKVVHNFPFVRGQTTASPHVMGGIAEILAVERDEFAALLDSESPDVARARMQQAADQQGTLARALVDGGVPREKLDGVLKAFSRTVAQFQIEGNWEGQRGKGFKLNPALDEYLRSIGLGDAQVALVVKLTISEWVRRVDQTGGITRADYATMLKQYLPTCKTENDRVRMKSALDSALSTGEKAIFGNDKRREER